MTPRFNQNVSLSQESSEISTASLSTSATVTTPNDVENYVYLTEDARRNLPHYQYRGADLSLLYQYALSPLANFCVERFVPGSMAPNSITLFGLAWMITAYAVYWYYAPTLEVIVPEDTTISDTIIYPPRWIFLWNAISMLAYQNLDNMDGKQARRTKSSSPLGLLFDHGCDAINSIFGSANWIISMALVPSENHIQCWALVFGPFAMFYVATWEQYYTGELIMPIINGPNEGLMGGILLSVTSWIYGPDFWQGNQWSDAIQAVTGVSIPFRNCDLVIAAASAGFLQEIVIKFFQVCRKYRGSMLSLSPFAVFTACFVAVAYIDPNVWLSAPRLSLHLAMLLFVEMSTEIMLAHVTAQTFYPLRRWQLLPLIGMTFWVLCFGSENAALLESWILLYTCLMGLYLGVKVTLVIQEICSSLGIWCFDIMTPHPNSDQPNSLKRAKKV